MDGNQRWAKFNKINNYQGYYAGLENIKKIANLCIKNKIENLTIYALSADNLKRKSINLIFSLMKNNYINFLNELKKDNKIKIQFIGNKLYLPKKIVYIIDQIENNNQKNSQLNLNIAFNYHPDYELLNLVNKSIKKYKKEISIKEINNIKKYRFLKDVPDPDILIRTGGYQRLSGFLLLNLAYTELFFTNTMWPDFNEIEFNKILAKFKKIKRNYGL